MPVADGSSEMVAHFVCRIRAAFAVALGCLLLGFGLLPAEEPPAGTPIKIGLPANLFRDIPRITADALLPTFGKLMEGQTGMKGQPILLADSNEVAQQLADGK